MHGSTGDLRQPKTAKRHDFGRPPAMFQAFVDRFLGGGVSQVAMFRIGAIFLARNIGWDMARGGTYPAP